MPATAVTEFLSELTASGVRVRVENGELHCQAPTGTLSEPLLARVRAHKAEILAVLQQWGNGDPLSLAQERIWLEHRFDPADTAYHLPLQLGLDGALALAALRHSLAEVVRRHCVLRSSFAVVDGEPRQRVAPFTRPPLPLVDLTGLPPGSRAAVRGRLAATVAEHPFHLDVGPPQRAVLVQMGAATHDLLLTRHHIASDGWSLGVIADELGEHYRAALRGEGSGLPELRWQYADHARWQRATASSDAVAVRIEDWRRRLTGLDTNWNLLSEPTTDRYAVATAERTLDGTLAAAVARVARLAGATEFGVIAAAFGLAATSASGQRSLIIGVPVSGRTHPETERLAGCFATAVPVGLDYRGDVPFLQVVRAVRDEIGLAVGGHDLPAARVVDVARPARGRPSLYPVVLTMQNAPLRTPTLAGVHAAVTGVPWRSGPKFPLAVTIDPAGAGYRLLAEYDAARLSEATLDAVMERFVRLLDRAVERPTESIRALVRAAAGGPPAGSAAAAAAGPSGSVGSRFIQVARRCPDGVAVVAEQVSLTYSALHRRACKLAAVLRDAGVSAESPVGVCVEHSAALPVALLAVALSGGFAVPLDPDDPPARHESVLADSGVGVLVVGHGQEVGLRWFDGRLLLVRADGTTAEEAQPGRLPAVAPDQLAYAVYTSGSTGSPKGVMVSHRNVLALFAAARRAFHFDVGGVWSMTHSSAFDFSVWELWGPLLHGGRVVVVPRASVRDPAALSRIIRTAGVTLLSSTPTAFRTLLEHADPADLPTVVLGGERVEPLQLGAWFDRHRDGVCLVNMYGITETTVHVTCRPLVAADVRAGSSPIGSPLPGVHAAVVDSDGVPVVSGGAGELLVSGHGVARGYLHAPGLTADRFRPRHGGVRWYRSGDRVRVGSDGDLFYLGRTDLQVKVRGYRIEPAEVEAALNEHPEVASAVVVTVDGPEGRRTLAAYVVPVGPGTASGLVLRRQLSQRLPAHMVPTVFVTVQALPQTRNGKVDRAALPPPERSDAATAAVEAPTTATEAAVALIWCELLGVPAVGRSDDFFAMGGDSLLLSRVHARLAADLGSDLSLREVHEATDIAALAAAIDSGRRGTPTGEGTQ